METKETCLLPTCRYAGDGALAWTVDADVIEEEAAQVAAYGVCAPNLLRQEERRANQSLQTLGALKFTGRGLFSRL